MSSVKPRLISLHVVKYTPGDKEPTFIASTHDVSSFPYMARNSVKETCAFLTRNLMMKANPGGRMTVNHDDYQVCCMRYEDGLGVFAVTTIRYPSRVAFQCCNKVNVSFRRAVATHVWKRTTKDHELAKDFHKELREQLSAHSDPLKFDAITQTSEKVQTAQNEVRKTIEQVFENGQQLDDLMDRSKDLSDNTASMLKQSKKVKKGYCCKVM